MLFPTLNASRTLIDLSGIWEFKLDDGTGFKNKWYESRLEDSLTIAVPASYNDQKTSEEIRNHCGYVFYQRELSVPKILCSQRIVLSFGAVAHYAKVYLNGELICEHKGGFLPFEAEVGDKIKYGCTNLLTVAVDNKLGYDTLPVGNESGNSMMDAAMPQMLSVKAKKKNTPNFDFFNYAGIIRPVKVYSTPKNYIKDITIAPSVKGDDASVFYNIDTVGEGDVRITVYSQCGDVVAEAAGTKGSFAIKNAHLWEPLKPYLYTAKVVFNEDCYEQTFGVRFVEVRGNQFLINGKPFYFKGFGKHEDSNIHGRGLDEVLNIKDISLIKWLGANSFRTSHYPYSEEMLNLCDREGIVVIAEAPAVGLNFNMGRTREDSSIDTYEVVKVHQHHRDVITDMISRDKNHPCIVMWCIANEPDTAANSDSAYNYFRPLYKLAHECDPQNRPVTITGVMSAYVNDKTIPAMDVICLNRYYGWYVCGGDIKMAKQMLSAELSYWKTQNKPVIFTEYGADAVLGLRSTIPVMFTEEYQVECLKMNNQVFDEYDCVVGEHVWNFADFQTEEGLMRVDGNKKGVFARDRSPKFAAHYMRARWSNIPDFNYKLK